MDARSNADPRYLAALSIHIGITGSGRPPSTAASRLQEKGRQLLVGDLNSEPLRLRLDNVWHPFGEGHLDRPVSSRWRVLLMQRGQTVMRQVVGDSD